MVNEQITKRLEQEAYDLAIAWMESAQDDGTKESLCRCTMAAAIILDCTGVGYLRLPSMDDESGTDMITVITVKREAKEGGGDESAHAENQP